MKQKFIALLLTLFTLTAILAGCGGSSPRPDETDASASTENGTGADGILTHRAILTPGNLTATYDCEASIKPAVSFF